VGFSPAQLSSARRKPVVSANFKNRFFIVIFILESSDDLPDPAEYRYGHAYPFYVQLPRQPARFNNKLDSRLTIIDTAKNGYSLYVIYYSNSFSFVIVKYEK
jgi:hypothetical protein